MKNELFHYLREAVCKNDKMCIRDRVTHGKKQAESDLADLGKAFLKRASVVKCDYAGIYHAGQKLSLIHI